MITVLQEAKKGREWKGDGGKGLEHDSRNWLKVFQAEKDKKGCTRKKCIHKDNPDDMSDFRFFLNK